MDEEGFRGFCTKRNIKEKTIKANVAVIEDSEAFLKGMSPNKRLSNASGQDINGLVAHLVKDGKNNWEDLLALVRYARYSENREAEVAILELLDGSNVLENLSEKVRETVGESKHAEVFGGLELPPLGTLSTDKPRITRMFMERLGASLDEKTCREILSSGPHANPREEYLQDRTKFLKSKNVDDFLRKKHEEYVEELDRHRREKTLYFTQEIDEEVVDYVRRTATCQCGVREGDIIYVTKIPYMAKKFLHEKDERRKRYYYCHCPWVREAMLTDERIPPDFCYCSAGFEKRPWDVIFDEAVTADVVETVLKGDSICKFAIHIPSRYLEP
ncbi:MAG TPA: hypothetical protein VMS77_00865 [Conexivisphaerales archaeon]|nr:hypothetical protein [Conexivisphaerales archaeon]